MRKRGFVQTGYFGGLVADFCFFGSREFKKDPGNQTVGLFTVISILKTGRFLSELLRQPINERCNELSVASCRCSGSTRKHVRMNLTSKSGDAVK